MNLTEPQAGSDLGQLKSRAVKNGDHYLVSGQKIFITYGEHDMAENIVHLVLARTPDAPAGVRGISLFIVPKYLPGSDGTPGKRNDLRCVSLEHKLGIHASPTCVMSFGENGGARGWLVGAAVPALAKGDDWRNPGLRAVHGTVEIALQPRCRGSMPKVRSTRRPGDPR
jgi:alkylation response protein AidB-like acyl-CoA dehydrogenase